MWEARDLNAARLVVIALWYDLILISYETK
jgi:hypothetical protein